MTNGAAQVGLLQRAKNILLKSSSEWSRIDGEPATIGGLYATYVMPLLAIPAVAILIGIVLFGADAFRDTWPAGAVIDAADRIGANNLAHALVASLALYLLMSINVFIQALIINLIAPVFGGQRSLVRAFKVAAYSYTPWYLAGVLYVVPALSLVVATIGLYSLYLFYKGLPILMKAAPQKALLYLILLGVIGVVLAIILAIALLVLFMRDGPLRVTDVNIEAQNVTVQDVANQLAEDAGPGESIIRPGKWRQKMSIEKISAPGWPPEIAEEMKRVMGEGQLVETCLKPEEVRQPTGKFFGGNENCRYDHFTMGNGKLDAKMNCEQGGSAQVMEMSGTYSPESYTMRMTTTMQGMPGPAGEMRMRMRVDAERVGECTGEEA